MDDQRDVAEPAAGAPSSVVETVNDGAAAEGSQKAATADGQAAGATGTPRKRRRGGRGRGRGGANRTTAAGSTEQPAADGEPAPESGAPDEATTDGAASAAKPRPRRRPSGSAATKQPGAPTRAPADAGGEDSRDASVGAADQQPSTTEQPSDADATGAPTATGAARKRRRRGGRGRGRKPATAAGADQEASENDEALTETVETQRDDATPDTTDGPEEKQPAAAKSASRSSRSRGGRSRKPKTSVADASTGPPTEEERSEAPPTKPRSRMSIEEQIAAGGPTRGIKTTRSRTGRDGRRRREPQPTPPRITDKVMVITEHDDRDQIAVLEEDVLVQHYVTRIGATSMVGNIYLGRVQNVLPGMEAAFVDVGRGRNGVLYAGEVNYSPEDIEGPAPRIEQLLKPGQAVMVQVTKDPMGGKGARLTANLSLAGRYLVLAPNQNLQGISRRLPDEERRRLKSILRTFKPDEHGVIVRTAAEGAADEDLVADLQRLLKVWDEIGGKAKKLKAPVVLYEEPELTVRVVRDLFTDAEYKALVTDSQRVYDTVTSYAAEIAPDLAAKIQLHRGPLSAFEEHRIVEQVRKALDKKVWLPSGGYLFIERTEAMTIIDVNTGKSVGKTNLEETVVNTNLEAAREVARQLRLRDIGGIIVVDFIDMLLEKNKRTVEDTMRESLAIDKTRSQVFEIGPLGLMQVTRKRVSSGLVESFSQTCPTCEGRGILIDYDVS